MGANTGADEKKLERLKELTAKLKEAAKAYYAEDREVMSNLEYDRLYDELLSLENETGITLAGSPTQRVGYEAAESLPKERHAAPMLSLDKTKSREELAEWLGDQEGLLSIKLDGLTVVLTYRGGRLFKAVTRGDGEVGEVITENAKAFTNVPLAIPFEGELVLRGEAVISYADFDRINEKIEAEAATLGRTDELGYKNPRNLCSGSVRQLDPKVTAERSVRFIAFSLVTAEGADFKDSHEEEFIFLKKLGFEVVPYVRVGAADVVDAVGRYEREIPEMPVPSDGLVLLMDGISYGASLGRTAKFPRNAIAFKWMDAQAETELLQIEWSASRTGLLNPVAVFSPVELEGTTVRRASVHNLSIVKSLELGIGDRILVYKANMIIPQIADNLTRSGSAAIPESCPVCGGKTLIKGDEQVQVLYCPNPDCAAKRIKAFSMFVSRPAMGIDGLSEMSLEKLISAGLIHEFADIYKLADKRDEIAGLDGFGEKSADKLLAAIEKSRKTTPDRVLAAVGIPGVGPAGARILCRRYAGDIARIREAGEEELSETDGIGPVLASQIRSFFENESNSAMFDRLLAELSVDAGAFAAAPADSPVSGKTFVVTGSLSHFENRDALKRFIEERGGKVTGSVTKKTDYLINNDAASTSSKNKKAAELGIPILTEEGFLEMIGEDA